MCVAYFAKRLISIVLITIYFFGYAIASDFLTGVTLYNSGHYSEALELFKTAAKEGDLNAEYYLGEMYYNGRGVQHNYDKAKRHYEAARWMGEGKLSTLMTKKEYEKFWKIGGYKALLNPAEAGDKEAQYQLGLLFYNGGMGFPQDDFSAREWLGRAAAQGHEKAAKLLAEMPEFNPIPKPKKE